MRFAFGIIGVAVALTACGPTNSTRGAAPTSSLVVQRVPPTATTAPAEPVLQLMKGGGCEVTATGTFVKYSGKVMNISGRPLNRVRAVVTYSDASGAFVKTDTTSLDFDPLLPGQTSPFTAITQPNPAITNCAVEFQEGISGPKLMATREE